MRRTSNSNLGRMECDQIRALYSEANLWQRHYQRGIWTAAIFGFATSLVAFAAFRDAPAGTFWIAFFGSISIVFLANWFGDSLREQSEFHKGVACDIEIFWEGRDESSNQSVSSAAGSAYHASGRTRKLRWAIAGVCIALWIISAAVRIAALSEHVSIPGKIPGTEEVQLRPPNNPPTPRSGSTTVAPGLRLVPTILLALGLCCAIGGVVALTFRRSNAAKALFTVGGISFLSGATLFHIDSVALQLTYSPRHERCESCQLVQLEELGPFDPGASEGADICDGFKWRRLIRSIDSLYQKNSIHGFWIVGGFDRRPLKPSLLSAYGGNCGLAAARADWVRNQLIARVGPPMKDMTMVTTSGPSVPSYVFDDRLTSIFEDQLARDRKVRVYALIDCVRSDTLVLSQ
jgi:hypothetical protein